MISEDYENVVFLLLQNKAGTDNYILIFYAGDKGPDYIYYLDF